MLDAAAIWRDVRKQTAEASAMARADMLFSLSSYDTTMSRAAGMGLEAEAFRERAPFDITLDSLDESNDSLSHGATRQRDRRLQQAPRVLQGAKALGIDPSTL
jgi:hypothetical protein